MSLIRNIRNSVPCLFRESRRSRQRGAAGVEPLEQRQLLTATPIAELSDEFDDGGSVAQWNRLNEVEGWNADQLNVYDINDTQAGRMVQQPHTAVWYQNWRGPMAFQSVTGDFAITSQVHITDRDDVGGSDADDIPGDAQFSLGGVMIRTPRDISNPAEDWAPGSMLEDGTNNGENYVFLSAGYGAAQNEFSLEAKTTRNSNSQLELTPLGQDANTVTVQIARIGSQVITLYQLPGQDWQVHRRYNRPDLPDTMQVGLVTYTDWSKASDFDPYVQNSTVLVPGVAGDPTPAEPFNPDITVGFEYARYVRPDVPDALTGADLTNPAQVSDAELLSFLGAGSNIAAGANSAPVLDPIADLELSYSSDPVDVVLPVSDADTPFEGLQVEAIIIEDLAAAAVGEHGLYSQWANYGQNWGGQNEKWLLAADGGYFFLLPDGQLREWHGSFENSSLIAELTPAFHEAPEKLLAAQPALAAVNIDGITLTVDPAGVEESFSVRVVVDDGTAQDSQTFGVVINGSQLMLRAGESLSVVLPDDELPAILDSLEVSIPRNTAAELTESVGLSAEPWLVNADYGFNYLGNGERCLQSSAGWHFIEQDGAVHQWSGNAATSPLVAMLTARYHEDPGLILDAESVSVDVSVIGSVLTLNSLDDTEEDEFDLLVLGTAGGMTYASQISVSLVAPGTAYVDHDSFVGDDAAEEDLLDELFSDWVGV